MMTKMILNRRGVLSAAWRSLMLLVGFVALPERASAQAWRPFGFGFGAGGAGGIFGASIDMNFATGSYIGLTPSNLTVSRASAGTDLLPSSVSGYAYTTYGNNVARISANAGGLIVEESRTNNLLNSAAPVTQTTASLGTGTYTLWVNGSGTATPSGGTATVTGAAAASQGSPNTFVVTVAGTVVVTVGGSLNFFQLELGTWGTSGIVTTGAAATRSADVVSAPFSPGAQYTIFAAGVPLAPVVYGTNQEILEANDGTVANRSLIRRTLGTGVDQESTVISSAETDASLSAVWAQGALKKIALAAQSGSIVGAFSGNTNTASPTGVTVGITTLDIGSRAAGALFWNGIISRVAIWPNTALSAAQLQAITT